MSASDTYHFRDRSHPEVLRLFHNNHIIGWLSCLMPEYDRSGHHNNRKHFDLYELFFRDLRRGELPYMIAVSFQLHVEGG